MGSGRDGAGGERGCECLIQCSAAWLSLPSWAEWDGSFVAKIGSSGYDKYQIVFDVDQRHDFIHLAGCIATEGPMWARLVLIRLEVALGIYSASSVWRDVKGDGYARLSRTGKFLSYALTRASSFLLGLRRWLR